jgi:hypothetical protein
LVIAKVVLRTELLVRLNIYDIWYRIVDVFFGGVVIRLCVGKLLWFGFVLLLMQLWAEGSISFQNLFKVL